LVAVNSSGGEARLGRVHWLAALLVGLQLVLLVLITGWLLRACTPVEAVLRVTAFETPAPSAPEPPLDPSQALRASLKEMAAEGTALTTKLAELQAELDGKLTRCPKAELPKEPSFPADRWARKDITILEGCWVLGRPVAAVRGDLGSPTREENCTRTAGRICFGSNGVGRHEETVSCPIGGSAHCSAPIRAKFEDDGTLHTTQPRVRCSDPSTYWLPYEHTCRRVDDNLTVCRSSSFPGFPSRELEFRRAP
jgi:hypothetical protein